MLNQPLNIPIKGDKYQLWSEYVYTWTIDDIPQRIRIPQGFEYDGASVPRAVWSISGIRPDGLLRAAATVHDWMYRHKGKLPHMSHQMLKDGRWQPARHEWTREEADRMFGRLMREAGCSKWRRRAAYQAVKWFGWTGW